MSSANDCRLITQSIVHCAAGESIFYTVRHKKTNVQVAASPSNKLVLLTKPSALAECAMTRTNTVPHSHSHCTTSLYAGCYMHYCLPMRTGSTHAENRCRCTCIVCMFAGTDVRAARREPQRQGDLQIETIRLVSVRDRNGADAAATSSAFSLILFLCFLYPIFRTSAARASICPQCQWKIVSAGDVLATMCACSLASQVARQSSA